MDPYMHTLIAVFLLWISYFIGRILGRVKGVMDGRAEGAENLIDILDQEGTYKRENLYRAVERWTIKKLEE